MAIPLPRLYSNPQVIRPARPNSYLYNQGLYLALSLAMLTQDVSFTSTNSGTLTYFWCILHNDNIFYWNSDYFDDITPILLFNYFDDIIIIYNNYILDEY